MARATNGAIGLGGALPWRLPADLKRFKALTLDGTVLMGRRTWDAIGRPLPGRRNLVLTRRPAWSADGAEPVATLADALARAGGRLFVIGGAEVIALAEPEADAYELTEVHAAPAFDTALPLPDPLRWRETARADHPADDDRPAYSFVTLTRR